MSESRPTEETRLTISRSSLGDRNPYYYTGMLDLQETKIPSIDGRFSNAGEMFDSRGNLSDYFMVDESTIDYTLKEDENGNSFSMTSKRGLLHSQSIGTALGRDEDKDA